MKLEVTIYPKPFEHEVHLGVEELGVLISEAVATESAETLRDFLRLAGSGSVWLKAVPDELIAQLNSAQRHAVAAFLREQADRFERSEVKP